MNKLEHKIIFSALWAVVMLNMIKADVLSLYIPGTLDELVQFAGDTPIETLMLVGAIVMELPILMVVLSLVLPDKINRWANLILPVLVLVFIWGGGSLKPHYLFIASVETLCLGVIFWRALKWGKHTN